MKAVRGLLTLLALAGAAAPAHAAGPTTMEGTCRLSGVLEFEPPLANAARDVRFRDRASGTCSGTLNGVPRVDVAVDLRAKGAGTVSCVAGETTSTGTLSFATGEKLRFWTHTTGAITQFVSRFGGAVAGDGVAHVDFLTRGDPATLEACESGTLAAAPYELTTRTLTPVVG